MNILDKSRAVVRETLRILPADKAAVEGLDEGQFVTVKADGNEAVVSVLSADYAGVVANLYVLLEDGDASSVSASESIGVARVGTGFRGEVKNFEKTDANEKLTAGAVLDPLAVNADGNLARNDDGASGTIGTTIGYLYKVPADDDDTAIFVTV